MKSIHAPRVPSLDALRVFAVAARHLSFTKAAEELNLTQSAVSHRIKTLEQELGLALFDRLVRRLELTQEGRRLAHGVDQAIGGLNKIIGDLRCSRTDNLLKITMLPSVAMGWLIPRLAAFRDEHPQIEVQVIAESRLVDLRGEGIDLALRFGRGPYPDYAATALMQDQVFPVCSPGLIAPATRLPSIDALLEWPLLHDSQCEDGASGADWRSWMRYFGRTDASCHLGQRFSQTSLAIEAAIFGMGIALGRASLVADAMTTGKLICPLPMAAPTKYSYFLLSLPEAADLPKVSVFRTWLQTLSVAPRQGPTESATDRPW